MTTVSTNNAFCLFVFMFVFQKYLGITNITYNEIRISIGRLFFSSVAFFITAKKYIPQIYHLNHF